MTPAARFRELLLRDGTIVAPGAPAATRGSGDHLRIGPLYRPPGSHRAPGWRKPDSNHQSPLTKEWNPGGTVEMMPQFDAPGMQGSACP